MADALDDLDTSMFEVDIVIRDVDAFQLTTPDGAQVQLIVMLMESDAPVVLNDLRDGEVGAFGVVYYRSDSFPCPQEGVVWERLDNIVRFKDEAHPLDEGLQELGRQAVVRFLRQVAQKDPQRPCPTPPGVH